MIKLSTYWTSAYFMQINSKTVVKSKNKKSGGEASAHHNM